MAEEKKRIVENDVKKPYDSDAKRRWDKENTVMFSVKFFNTPASDKDIIDYFNSHVTAERSKSKIIKEALREKMERENIKKK